MALTAGCLACMEGVSISEFCSKSPSNVGCTLSAGVPTGTCGKCGSQCKMAGGQTGVCQTDLVTCAINIVAPACPPVLPAVLPEPFPEPYPEPKLPDCSGGCGSMCIVGGDMAGMCNQHGQCAFTYDRSVCNSNQDVAISATTVWPCDKQGCNWADFRENVDWGFLDQSNGDCDACKLRCSTDNTCTAIECGNGYCSAWFNGRCAYSTSPLVAENQVSTCRRPSTLLHKPWRFIFTCLAEDWP